MKCSEITKLRLRNQHLTQPIFKKPGDVVRWFGAVQSQDFHAAKWALSLRMKNAVDQDIEEAFNKGEFLRTHVMRQTWHFVMPEDIRWMLELTAPRVKNLLRHYYRRLELTEKVLGRCMEILMKALTAERHLTRSELAEHLERSKIAARGQRLANIMGHAELDAVICSGPRRGKQLTYSLLSERAPNAKKLSREEARAKLILKYFQSHGPAQAKDFSWWSGLLLTDTQEGIQSIKSKLIQENVDGKTYWLTDDSKPRNRSESFLLSIYDEYTIAYKDRSALGGERYVEKMISMGNALTSVIIMDGKIVGTWKRVIKKDHVEVRTNLFRSLNQKGQQLLLKAVKRYGKFLELPVVLSHG
jgi:hypothetical protein